mgnify:FL=1
MKEIVVQKSWNDNLAASLATFCKYYNIKISKSSIYKSFNDSEKMQDFVRIQDFANTYAFEYSSGFFDKSNFKSLVFPILALVKGYRTVIIIDVTDTNITYLDSLTGKNTESLDEFISYATGHYFYLNPNSSYLKEVNFEKLTKLENELESKRNWVSPKIIELTPESLMTDFNIRV